MLRSQRVPPSARSSPRLDFLVARHTARRSATLPDQLPHFSARHARGVPGPPRAARRLDRPRAALLNRALGRRASPLPPLTSSSRLLADAVRHRPQALLSSPSRNAQNPVFVSPGHRLSLETCVRLALACTREGKIPEPVRVADRLGALLFRSLYALGRRRCAQRKLTRALLAARRTRADAQAVAQRLSRYPSSSDKTSPASRSARLDSRTIRTATLAARLDQDDLAAPPVPASPSPKRAGSRDNYVRPCAGGSALIGGHGGTSRARDGRGAEPATSRGASRDERRFRRPPRVTDGFVAPSHGAGTACTAEAVELERRERQRGSETCASSSFRRPAGDPD